MILPQKVTNMELAIPHILIMNTDSLLGLACEHTLGQQRATPRSPGYHGSGLKFSILFGSEYVCGPSGACGLGSCYACVLGNKEQNGRWIDGYVCV